MFYRVRRQYINISEPVHKNSSFPKDCAHYTMESRQCQAFSAFFRLCSMCGLNARRLSAACFRATREKTGESCRVPAAPILKNVKSSIVQFQHAYRLCSPQTNPLRIVSNETPFFLASAAISSYSGFDRSTPMPAACFTRISPKSVVTVSIQRSSTYRLIS